MEKRMFTGCLEVFSTDGNRYLRSCEKNGNLSELGQDENFSISLWVDNHTSQPFSWKDAWVRVDAGEARHWDSGRIDPYCRGRLRIARRNMVQHLSPGVHRAVWYFDGQAVHEESFFITREFRWERVFPMPSREQILSYRSQYRSPYLAGWLEIPHETRYTEYVVDFRAAHLPRGTYCCLGNWTMDMSGLEKKYVSVRTEYPNVSAYGGFQKTGTGKMVSIMSFWDIFCRDASGWESVIRAKRLYPKTVIDGESFRGEGTGARCITPYLWKENHWYRMHLKCAVSENTGNTLVEQWVTNLETGDKTLLARFDVGYSGSAFRGNIAIFLENFLPKYAGQIRSMEVRGARYRRADTGKWSAVTRVYVSSEGGIPRYEGSYRFGVEEDRLWMITSGVGGDWFSNGRGQKAAVFTLEDPEKR